MISPYFNGDQGIYAPPSPALAAALQSRTDQTEKLWNTIGNVAGDAGAGAVGAFQGFNNPQVFGADTSGGSGAFQGFVQDAAARQRSGSNLSGFASLVRGGNGGASGGSGGGTQNFKQIVQAGKTADSFRKTIQMGEQTLPDEESTALGVSDGEWGTLSPTEKMAHVGGYLQGQQQQEQNARIADTQAQGNERNAQVKAGQDAGSFLHTFATAGGSMEDRMNAGLAALPPDADVNRVMPLLMGSLDKFAALVQPKPTTTPVFTTDPVTGNTVVTAGNNMQLVKPKDDDLVAKPVLDSSGNDTGHRTIRVNGITTVLPPAKPEFTIEPGTVNPITNERGEPTVKATSAAGYEAGMSELKKVKDAAAPTPPAPASTTSKPAAAAPAATNSNADVPKVKNAADLAALPKGKKYVDPDGVTRFKQ